jgi:hypothetical protein
VLTRGNGSALEQRRWHATLDRGGDAALRHGGEASDRGCRERGAASDRLSGRCGFEQGTVGQRLYGSGVTRSRVSPTRCVAPGGGSALMSGPGAEREVDRWDPVVDFIPN